MRLFDETVEAMRDGASRCFGLHIVRTERRADADIAVAGFGTRRHDSHVSNKQADASKMLDFLKSEEPRLKADLERAEAALTAYQRQSGSINASDEAKVYLEGSVQYEQQIAALRLQMTQLAERYGDDHPTLVAARQQMAELQAERTKYADRFRDLPATEVKAVQLQRDAKVAEDIYVLLLNRVQELSVQKAGTGGNVHIVDAALRPGAPVKPKKMLIISAAVILGLIAGTGFVFLRRNLFKGIDDPDHVERAFHLPVFGLVPQSAEQVQLENSYARGGERLRPVLANARPKDVTIESLRSLRTAMQFTLMDARNRIVMVSQAQDLLKSKEASLQAALDVQAKAAQGQAQTGLVSQARDSLANYFNAVNDTAKMKADGKNELAQAYLFANVAQYRDELEGIVETLRIEKNRQKDAAIDELNSALATTTTAIGAATGAAIVVLLLISALLYRQITRPLSRMRLQRLLQIRDGVAGLRAAVAIAAGDAERGRVAVGVDQQLRRR